jgi:hypothetical protein
MRTVCRPGESLARVSLPEASVAPRLISSIQTMALGSVVIVSAAGCA